MINELHQLSMAMHEAGIIADSRYREYIDIPEITKKRPCVRIVLSDGKVVRLEQVPFELGKNIRKYGNKQGSFPAMNLAALYRVTDENIKKRITDLIRNNGQSLDIVEVKKWCDNSNYNWGEKVSNKYRICMVNKPKDLLKVLGDVKLSYPPLNSLIESVELFRNNPPKLHQELERQAFELLERKKNIVLALQILFYSGKEDKNAEDDFGTLSVIFDSAELEDKGVQSAGLRFTRELNQVLLQAEKQAQQAQEPVGAVKSYEKDAFGITYTPINQPMPEVKLDGGVMVSLRTMYRGHPCQYRYRRIENATYPISLEKRQQLHEALEWISRKEQEDKTWVKIDRSEFLFVYPSKLPKAPLKFARFFKRGETPEHQRARFETEASNFREYVSKTKHVDPEHYPDYMQIFVLRKLDKARSKVVYTRHTTPDEIVQHSEEWQKASNNLPHLMIGQPRILFPMEIAGIMNCVWRQDGVMPVDAYKPVASYHGIELLFGVPTESIMADLHRMVRFSSELALYEGRRFQDLKVANRKKSPKKDGTFWRFRDTVMLIGMLLYWTNIRKGDYVKEYSYLLGQLLKVSDSLHELYCHIERNEENPLQFVGSSLYVSAAEMPSKTLSQLGMRLKPYIAWAKTHKDKCIIRKRQKADGTIEQWSEPKASYYLSVFEKTANQISSVLTDQTRFNDSEKALLFIGYLASFPKTEHKMNESAVENEESIGG